MPKPSYSLETLRLHTEQALDSVLPKGLNEPLAQAMRYSSLNGGKRLRAMLVYSAGLTFDAPLEKLDAAACAVECIHAYSLIHDDLPAMDDDDLRRGKPTSHKKFGEVTAILAGDALQTLAFELLSESDSSITNTTIEKATTQKTTASTSISHSSLSPYTRLNMIKLLAKATGASGMVGGQMLDMLATKQDISLEQLQHIHRLKTGALIQASTLLGAQCSEKATDQDYALIKHYADNIGLAFQIVDDILDETADTHTLGKQAGADKALGKSTYVALLGLEKAQLQANQLVQQALQSLGQLSHNTLLLEELASLVLNRIH